MKTLLIALGLSAAAATLPTPAHAYYLRDCLRGAPCPGFNVPSPDPTFRPGDTMVHRPTMLHPRDTTFRRGDTMVRHQPTTTMTSRLEPAITLWRVLLLTLTSSAPFQF